MTSVLLKTFGRTWQVSDGRRIVGYLQRSRLPGTELDTPEAFADSPRYHFYTDATLEHDQTITGHIKTYIVKIIETDAEVTFAEGHLDLQLNRYLVEAS